MNFKKTVAFAAAFALLCTAAPFAPLRQTEAQPVICAYAAEVDTAVGAFLDGAVTEGANYAVVGEGRDVTSLTMCGRTYGSGVQFSNKWNAAASITLNVADCTALNFTAGHVDGADGNKCTLTIELDGEEYDSVELSDTSELHEFSLPVKNVSVAKITFGKTDTNTGVYGIAGIQTDAADSAKAYTIPDYTKCSTIPAQIFNLKNGTLFAPGEETALKMSGRSFEGGVSADVRWNTSSCFGVNVENLDSLSVTFGHVDDTETGKATLQIFIDGHQFGTYDLTDRMALQTVELPLKKKFSAAVFVISQTDNDAASYGFGDFKANTSQDAPADIIPVYETGKDITDAAFDLKFGTVYPIDNGKYEDPTLLTMCGRSYDNGIVLEGKWNETPGFGINTENADELTFTVGHADGEPGGSSQLHLFLDGQEYKLLGDLKLTDTMPLQTITLPVQKVQSVQFVLDKTPSGYGSYGFADFRTTSAKDEVPFTVSAYETGKDLVETAFNPRNITVYPIPSENVFEDPEMLMMNGRAYANGLVMKSQWNDISSVGFNTDEIDKLHFTVGHADDHEKNEQSAKLHIYLDGTEAEELSPLTLTESMPLTDVDLDVADVQSVVLVLDKTDSNSVAFGIADLIAEKGGSVSASDVPAFTSPEYTDGESVLNTAFNLEAVERFVNDASEYEEPKTFTVNGKAYTVGMIATVKWNYDTWFGVNTDNADEISCTVGYVEDSKNAAAKLTVYIDGEAYEPYTELALSADMEPVRLTIPTANAQSVVFYIPQTGSSTAQYAFTDFSVKAKEAVVTEPAETTTTEETTTTTTTEETTTTTTTTEETTTTTAAPEEPIKGDYNGDGEVTVSDAVLLARFCAEDDTLTDEQVDTIIQADPDQDQDGFITILDLILVIRLRISA